MINAYKAGWLEKQGEQKPAEEYNITGIGSKHAEGKLGEMIKNLKHDNEVLEQKPAEKVEPKFKVDDWINGYYTNYKVLSVNNEGYVVEDVDGNKINILFENEKFHHLWTIKDAKDGDVLVNGSNIFIFHFINDTRLMGYCHVNTDGMFYDDIGKNECFCLIDAVVNPATKEQRETLMKAMADAGYTFDFENKELKKIEQKPAWSEEDDYILGEVITHLEEYIRLDKENYSGEDVEYYKRDIDWLKSLKNRYAWKPSEEQMKALESATENCAYSEYQDCLRELIGQLKKLK